MFLYGEGRTFIYCCTELKTVQKDLREDFEFRKARNHRYSLRAYSKFLGVSHTSLSLFLRNKRDLSPEAKRQIILKLKKSRPELMSKVYQSPLLGTPIYEPIEFEKMAVVGDWYYFAILSLTEIADFESDPTWIAERLNIPVKTVESALQVLLKHEMIERDESGKIKNTGKNFSAPDQTVNLGVRRSHYQALDLARESLDRDGIHERSFLAMTMAIDPSRLAKAHKKIKKFQEQLMLFLEGGEKKEVYRFCTQLFPLSRSTKRIPK